MKPWFPQLGLKHCQSPAHFFFERGSLKGFRTLYGKGSCLLHGLPRNSWVLQDLLSNQDLYRVVVAPLCSHKVACHPHCYPLEDFCGGGKGAVGSKLSICFLEKPFPLNHLMPGSLGSWCIFTGHCECFSGSLSRKMWIVGLQVLLLILTTHRLPDHPVTLLYRLCTKIVLSESSSGSIGMPRSMSGSSAMGSAGLIKATLDL